MLFGGVEMGPTSDHYFEDEFPDADSYATPEEDVGTDGDENHPNMDPAGFVS